MNDSYIEKYGWCKVTCRFCGDEFNVHPLSNALSDNAALCGFCSTMKATLVDRPEPIYIASQPVYRPSWKVVAIVVLIEAVLIYGLCKGLGW